MKKEIIIKGENYTLRPLKEQDLDLKVKWINDPDVHAYLHYDIPINLKKTRIWFGKAVKDSRRYDFVIETQEGLPIGLIGLIGINERDNTAEIYITIGEKDYWGKGIMLETENTLIKWAFEHLGLDKIWAQTRDSNIASIITMKKLGFKIEGTLRKEKKILGQRVDIIRVGLLKEELKPI
jgi:RimJ/RimL family protein N-acetyltransferase